MSKAIQRVSICAAFLLGLPSAALPAPPASCVSKFVGVWTYSGGTTRVNADGTANPTCPMCVSVQTWTCNGNTYIITGPTSYTATLTSDGRQMIGSAGIAVRIGGASVAEKPKEPAQPSRNTAGATVVAKPVTKPAQPDAPKKQAKVVARTSSCSDITGTRSTAPAASECKPANRGLQEASVSNEIAKQPVRYPTPPSNGAAAIESLRSLLPELGKLVDEVDREVNSPNIPPPSQWQISRERAPMVTNRRPFPSSDSAPLLEISPSDVTPLKKDTEQNSSPDGEADDDYAEICLSESVKRGFQSLKQDFEEALKNEKGRYGVRFFFKKLKLQLATLKKCARDPMQKAVIEKLEQDPIILGIE